MAATVFAESQAETEATEEPVVWMTTGLSCDGDSVAMTSAVNPSLEDIVTQAIPGMPKDQGARLRDRRVGPRR